MNNKINGNALERMFANALSAKGYWVHRVQDKSNGQPFDVIAVKDNVPYVYDCKDCQNDVFTFDRIEDNQRLAFSKFLRCKNKECFFAVRYKSKSNVVYLMPYAFITGLEQIGKHQLTWKEVQNTEYIYNTIKCY